MAVAAQVYGRRELAWPSGEGLQEGLQEGQRRSDFVRLLRVVKLAACRFDFDSCCPHIVKCPPPSAPLGLTFSAQSLHTYLLPARTV